MLNFSLLSWSDIEEKVKQLEPFMAFNGKNWWYTIFPVSELV